jgi:hypothetical protein
MLPVCRIGKGGLNVLLCQFREVLKDVLLGHSRSQPTQDVIDADPHAANAGSAESGSGIDRDPFRIVMHDAKVLKTDLDYDLLRMVRRDAEIAYMITANW